MPAFDPDREFSHYEDDVPVFKKRTKPNPEPDPTTAYSEVLLDRVRAVIWSSRLFGPGDELGVEGALRDIIKMDDALKYGSLMDTARVYLKQCEDSRAEQEAKRAVAEFKPVDEIDTTTHPEQIIMGGGKTASSKIPPVWYIPTEVIAELAERFSLGVLRKKEKAWNALSDNQGEALTDRYFILDRIGHIIYHALKLRDVIASGDMDELKDGDNHASAILWGGAYLVCAKNALLKDSPSLRERLKELDGELREWQEDKPVSFATLPKSAWIGPKPAPSEDKEEIADATLEAGGKCPTDTNGDGDCHHCKDIGVCYKVGEWVAVPLYKEGSMIGEVIGYAIRWSTPNPKGEWFWKNKFMPGGITTIEKLKEQVDNECKALNEKGLTPAFFLAESSVS